MRRLHTAIGAAVLFVALTACAEGEPQIGFGGRPATPPPAKDAPDRPIEPVPTEQRDPVPEGSIDASALPEGYPHEVWTQNEGKVIVAVGQEGGCSDVRAEIVGQTRQKIKLVFVEAIPKPSGPCTMDLRYPPVTAKLDAPLGDRTVVLAERDVTVPPSEVPAPPR